MLVHDFGGDTRNGDRVDDKWDFAYAAQLAFAFSESWSLALEGYGTVERLGSTGHPSDAAKLFGDFNQHRLGPVLCYKQIWRRRQRSRQCGVRIRPGASEEAASTTLSVGFGMLAGLNDDTADHTLKLSIEVAF